MRVTKCTFRCVSFTTTDNLYPRSITRVCPGGELHLASDLDLMLFAFSDTPKAADGHCVQQQMKLHGSFVRRNWAQSKHRRARSITVASRLISLFLKRNLLFRSVRLAARVWHFLQQLMKHRSYICQGRCRWRSQRGTRGAPVTPMTQFPFRSAKPRKSPATDLACPAGKKHGHELAPTGEPTCVPFRVVLAVANSNSRRESNCKIVRKCCRLESWLSLLSFTIGSRRTRSKTSRGSAFLV